MTRKTVTKPGNRPKTKPVAPKKDAETAQNPPVSADNLPQTAVESPSEPEILSLSECARRIGKDRETVRNAILEAELQPKGKEKNGFLYDFEEVAALFEDDAALREIKLRKLTAEAELKEHELAIKRGEFASKAEFITVVQQIFGNLHKRLAVQQPNKLAAKLLKAKSSADVAKLLRDDTNAIFNALRNDFTEFL